MYGLTLVTAPTLEPVTIGEARRQLGLSDDNTYHDERLNRLIRTARIWVEQNTDRALLNQTWDYKFSHWPCGMEPIYVPKAPLSSVTSITYYDTAGASQTLATSVYKVLSSREPGEIRLKYQQSWPSLYSEPDVITIRFVAGYGATVQLLQDSAVGAVLRQAVLLKVHQLFDPEGAKDGERAAMDLLTSVGVGSEFHSYAS